MSLLRKLWIRVPLIAHNGGDNGGRFLGIAAASARSKARAHDGDDNDDDPMLVSLAPCPADDRRGPPDARPPSLEIRRPPPPEDVVSTPFAHCLSGVAATAPWEPMEMASTAGAGAGAENVALVDCWSMALSADAAVGICFAEEVFSVCAREVEVIIIN